MHASLHRRNFSNLSTRLRVRATAAADGCLDALLKLSADPDRPGGAMILPAYYAALDVTSISRLLDQMDSPSALNSPPVVISVTRAIVSLEAISSLTSVKLVDKEAFPDLWPRIWAWINFLDMYRECLHSINPAFDASRCYGVYVSVIAAMRKHRATASIIDSTHGVRAVVTRAWSVRLQGDKLHDKVFGTICEFLDRVLAITVPQNFEEVIEGAGGTMTALAKLVISHLTHVLADDRTHNRAYSISSLLELLGHGVAPEFTDALLRAGIVPPITSAVITLTRLVPAADGYHTERHLIDALLFTLVWYFTYAPGSGAVAQSLRSGLLSAILGCARGRATKALHRIVRELSTSLVYHSVLVQVRDTISGRDLESLDPNCGRELLETWENLRSLVAVRLGILREYEEGKYVSRRVCDNTACGAIAPKSYFRACSRCRISNYCSESCQTQDWRSGGHRDSCPELGSMHLSQYLCPRDKSFLRVLIHYDYLRVRSALRAVLVNFFRQQPDAIPCVLFDYTQPCTPCHVTVIPACHIDGFANYPAQAQASGGRMQLHMMNLVEGGETEWWMIPLHSETGDVELTLQLLAKETTAGGPMEQKGIEQMEGLNILEFH
ncbi:hypothetical protein DFH07DRAFT_968715 [Mycena maculata]|uniref:phytol kinase n=1 Tax=Mycena maculata TaxID=230809 RepID=A0AAD7I0P3_9AGAR|nr:hypothetical protein DFH07DRAFT_968715 [Mycena maculata]